MRTSKNILTKKGNGVGQSANTWRGSFCPTWSCLYEINWIVLHILYWRMQKNMLKYLCGGVECNERI